MANYKEKIDELEEKIKSTKYNKKTQHAIGLYKAQLAKLKDKEVSRGKKRGVKEGYNVKKSGDATVLLLGFPSVGKSTLLNQLTNKRSEVGAYDFTTLKVVPGLLEYKDAKIQILDVPGIVKGAASGRGRGREVLSVMRNADLVLIIIDANNPTHLPVILKEIYDAHMRINQKKPHVRIKKTEKNGIRIASTVRLDIGNDTIKGVVKEFKISNAEILIRDKIDIDQLIDSIEGNKKYLPAMIIINKSDTVNKKRLDRLIKTLNANIAISAEKRVGIEDLKEMIFKKLKFIRVYLKEPNKEADMKEPMILFTGAKIKDACQKIHRDMLKLFKFARVTGPSAKFPGQKLSLGHTLKDGDILEIHTF